MSNLFKHLTNASLVIIFALLIVANVKVSSSELEQDTNVAKKASAIPLIQTNEALAGPCGRRGCVGSKGDCGESHTVVEVGPIEIIRHCGGTDTDKPSDGGKSIKEK